MTRISPRDDTGRFPPATTRPPPTPIANLQHSACTHFKHFSPYKQATPSQIHPGLPHHISYSITGTKISLRRNSAGVPGPLYTAN